MGQLKTCSKCKQELPVTAFHKNRSRPDGLRTYCKFCHCATNRKWSNENPEKVRATRKICVNNNPEKYRITKESWKKANLEKVTNYKRKWEKNNPEKTRLNQSKKAKELRDGYIVYILNKTYGLTRELIPQELIEAKRAHLQLVRILKEDKQKCKSK